MLLVLSDLMGGVAARLDLVHIGGSRWRQWLKVVALLCCWCLMGTG